MRTIKDTIIRWLKLFRNGIAGLPILAASVMIVDKRFHFLTMESGDYLTILFIVPVLLAFILQIIIVLLVGKPPADATKYVDTSNVYMHLNELKDCIYEDILGANVNMRLFKLSLFWLSLVYLGQQLPLLFLLIPVVQISWSVTYSISRITFNQYGVRLESSSSCFWKFGRSISISYQELTVRGSMSPAGSGVSFFQDGNRRYGATSRFWDQSCKTEMAREITKRLQPNQYEISTLYKN